MKVVVLAGLDKSLVNFRGPLLRAMVGAGMEVVGAAPWRSPDLPQHLAAIGVRFVPVEFSRTGLNPLVDGFRLWRLTAFFRRERPEVLLSYTIKPVIYGSLAARWSRVPHIYALITGLGAAFFTRGLKGRFLRFTAVKMYRLALARCTKVLVQNREIAELFARESIVAADKMVVVPGSGVDTEHFSAVPIPSGPPVFLLLARMLRDKGVEEYVAAARLIKKEMPQTRFLLVGDTDPNPAAISVEQLNQWNQEGVVEYRTAVSDVRPLFAACSVYVLPSYHEGMPRSNLEAMAVGRPLITTDVIGCRETVFGVERIPIGPKRTLRGCNGLLVPVRSAEALAEAMRYTIDHPVQAKEMGNAGRQLAVKHFDVQRINALMLQAMDILPTPASNLLPASGN